MSSDLQIDANRKNSEASTGPITQEGKAKSSKNSFRHGLTASPLSMMPGEDIGDFLALANGLREEHSPTSITEDCLVTKMIEALWLSARAVRLQNRIIFEPNLNRKDFDLYMRYQIMHDRAFVRALDAFTKLRKEARASEIGFVSQKRLAEVHESKIRVMTARSASLESTTVARNTRNTPPAPATLPVPPACEPKNELPEAA